MISRAWLSSSTGIKSSVAHSQHAILPYNSTSKIFAYRLTTLSHFEFHSAMLILAVVFNWTFVLLRQLYDSSSSLDCCLETKIWPDLCFKKSKTISTKGCRFRAFNVELVNDIFLIANSCFCLLPATSLIFYLIGDNLGLSTRDNLRIHFFLSIFDNNLIRQHLIWQHLAILKPRGWRQTGSSLHLGKGHHSLIQSKVGFNVFEDKTYEYLSYILKISMCEKFLTRAIFAVFRHPSEMHF